MSGFSQNTSAPLRPRLTPGRCLAFAVSVGALILITRKVDAGLLLNTLKASEGRWWLLGLSLFGLGLVLQAWRWHQMLIVVRESVSFRTSLRYTLIGHCFSALLFGALVSDIMKAGLYARRRKKSTSTILVASALDRFYGGISTALYALTTLWIGFRHGLRLNAERGGWDWKLWSAAGGWGLVLVALIGVGGFLSRRMWWPRWVRARDQFARGFETLRSRPGLSVLLILAGVGVQLCISAVLALSLRAVLPGGHSVAWLELLWTFPAIGVVASLPVTVSGAGARDAAALWIWGMFGVPGPQCLAATLLTLAVNLAWALTGGLLLWSADHRTSASVDQPSPGRSIGSI